MKQNIGTINALVRITAGLSMVAWSTARLVRHPYKQGSLFMIACGAMKVGEGITKYCPVTELYQRGQDMSGMDLTSFSKQSETAPDNKSDTPF